MSELVSKETNSATVLTDPSDGFGFASDRSMLLFVVLRPIFDFLGFER